MKNKKSIILLLLLAVCTLLVCGCAQQEWAAVYYDVEFLNIDGTVYKAFVVQRHRGVICDLPAEAQAEVTEANGQTCIVYYEQTGWDQATDDVISDMKVNPVFNEETYRKEYTSFLVIFTDAEGNEISRQIVKKGEAAVPPTLEEGMIAIWDVDFSCITENITVSGTIVAEYADYIFDAGEGLFENGTATRIYEQVRYDAFNLSVIEKPVAEHKEFAGWKLVSVEDGGRLVKYEAQYVLAKYTVKFVGVDGRVIETIENVEYGSSVTAPDAPAIYMYEFVEWTGGDLSFIEGDTIFRAQYRGIEVTYIYHDINGDEFTRSTVRYGEVPQDVTAPEVEGMTFIGWNYDATVSFDDEGKAFVNVYASYADGVYFKVAFVINGKLVHAQLVREGNTPLDPSELVKDEIPEGMKLVGWEYAIEGEDGVEYKPFDFSSDVVTRNMTLRAILEPIESEENN